jgi:hypothetical protein
MKVKLTILEGESKVSKKLNGISEIEIRQGYMEFWSRNDEGQSKIELSIKVNLILDMIVFKHIKEKENAKKKERKSRVKRSLNKYSYMINKR